MLYWDVNKRKPVSLNCSKVDWPTVIAMLEEDLRNLSKLILDNELNNETLHSLLSNYPYMTHAKNVLKLKLPPYSQNCNSKNYKAIANMYLFMYQDSVDNRRQPHDFYLENWINYEELARISENKEIDAKRNSLWKEVWSDGKKCGN